MRDDQRGRLYSAEDAVHRQLDFAAAGARRAVVAGSELTLPLELRFGTLDAARRYALHVQRSAWFAHRFPGAAAHPLSVRRRRGAREAHYEAPGTIALHNDDASGGWQMRQLVLLHELAHHAAWHDGPPGPAHGAHFAGVLLCVVTQAAGAEVGLLLRVAYDRERVRAAHVV